MKCITFFLCVASLFILAVCESSANIDPNTAVGIWRFEGGPGDAVEDTSGNGNTGSLVKAERVEGQSGEGVAFDGSSHVAIPATETTDDFLDGFTYLLWVKPLQTPSGQHVRLIERDWHNPNILIGPTDFYGSFLSNGAIESSQIRGGEWEMEEWSFVALTHDGNMLSLYVNGETVADLKVGKPDFSQRHEGGAIWLAQWKGGIGWDFSGVLDEVAVFNVALTEQDLTTVMEDGLEKALAVTSTHKLATTWGALKR